MCCLCHEDGLRPARTRSGCGLMAQPLWSAPPLPPAAMGATVPLGRSQAVRQRILIPPCEGSIPSAPANSLACRSVAIPEAANGEGSSGLRQRPPFNRQRGTRMKNVAFTLVMLPPHTPCRRGWAARVAADETGCACSSPRRRRRRCATSPMPTPRSARFRPRCWLRAPPALAAGAAGRTAGRLLLSRARRAPGGGHQLPRDLQRSHRRAHHGVRAGLRAGLAQLPAAAAAPRVSAPGRWIPASCTCPSPPP